MKNFKKSKEIEKMNSILLCSYVNKLLNSYVEEIVLKIRWVKIWISEKYVYDLYNIMSFLIINHYYYSYILYYLNKSNV